MIKYVFFDCYGVLIPEEEGDMGDIKRWAKYCNVSVSEMEKFARIYWDDLLCGKISIDDFWDLVESKFSVTVKGEDRKKLFNSILKPDFRYTEIVNLVKFLKQKNYTCGILSDVFEPAKDLMDESGWYDDFDMRVLSCEVGFSKYSDFVNNRAEIFQFALEKYNLNPEECLFVDDRKENCESAEMTGFQTICENVPVKIVDRVKEVLGLD